MTTLSSIKAKATPEVSRSTARLLDRLLDWMINVFDMFCGPAAGDDRHGNPVAPYLFLNPSCGGAVIDTDLWNLLTEQQPQPETEEAARFLVKGAAGYVGTRHLSLSRQWSGLVKTAVSIKNDAPQARLDFSTMSPEELENFYAGSNAAARFAGKALVERYDFSPYRRLVDVAGGSGGPSVGVTESCPNIQATVVDLPATIPLTRKSLDAAGVSNRVDAHAANVVEGPFPGSYDVAVMKSIVQVLSADHARSALRYVNQSLEPGGTLFILGTILDDSRLSPSYAVKSNLNYLNIYDEGWAYTEGEYRNWLVEACFDFLERVVVADGTSIIKARKPDQGAADKG